MFTSIMKRTAIIFMLLIGLLSCKRVDIQSDASGTFESDETLISAEVSGVIKQLNIEEGQHINEGEVIGYIDSTQLVLKRQQLEHQIKAVLSKNPDINKQLAALTQQYKHAQSEQQRIARLAAADAATGKQLDDANAQVDVLKSQLDALESSLSITSQSISQEAEPLKTQIEQLKDQISKARIVNPVKGTVLSKYALTHEMVTLGKPLYKIADLSVLRLKAYITGNQLSQIRVGGVVKVLVDNFEGTFKEYEGVIEHISDKSEFTPKTIQTKDERANLVYGIRIRVKNDGFLKIGMYGEVKFI